MLTWQSHHSPGDVTACLWQCLACPHHRPSATVHPTACHSASASMRCRSMATILLLKPLASVSNPLHKPCDGGTYVECRWQDCSPGSDDDAMRHSRSSSAALLEDPSCIIIWEARRCSEDKGLLCRLLLQQRLWCMQPPAGVAAVR